MGAFIQGGQLFEIMALGVGGCLFGDEGYMYIKVCAYSRKWGNHCERI